MSIIIQGFAAHTQNPYGGAKSGINVVFMLTRRWNWDIDLNSSVLER